MAGAVGWAGQDPDPALLGEPRQEALVAEFNFSRSQSPPCAKELCNPFSSRKEGRKAKLPMAGRELTFQSRSRAHVEDAGRAGR